jgi:tetratricopeptide (TPR) repeat protein
MQGTFADNPYYVEYEALLKRLHRMIAEGRGDSDEADALRDEMDRPERQLSYEEMERLGGLSADLYMLQDDEVYEPLEPGEDPADRAPERLRERVTEAWERGDAEDALALLRKGSVGFSQDQLAYIRARAYEKLGHLDTALLFMRYAEERCPEDNGYRWGILHLLNRLEQSEELHQRAHHYLQDESTVPEMRVHIAGHLFELTRGMAREQSAPVFELIIRYLEPALRDLESTSHLLLPDLPYYGRQILGYCYARLGRREDALDAFEMAMGSQEIRPHALAARGLLLVAESPEAALSDFREAVAGHVPLLAPYLYLAHDAFGRGDYEQCLQLCGQALGKTHDPALKAIVLQWVAIAGYEQGLPAERVRCILEAALRMDPLNSEIRHTLEVFQQAAAAGSTSASFHDQWGFPVLTEAEVAYPSGLTPETVAWAPIAVARR